MHKLFSALLNYFVKGLLIVLPLGAAFFLIFWTFSTVDNALNLSDQFLYIPGLGILSVIILILIAGIIVTYLITEPIKNWFNRWLSKLPLFKFIFSSVKDLTEALVGDEKKLSEPVMVEDVNGFKRIGFLTQKNLTVFGSVDEVAIYFPWSYSFAGQVVIVHKDKVKPLNISAAQAMKFIISGGVGHI
jgi:uncharacterized membrane protein